MLRREGQERKVRGQRLEEFGEVSEVSLFHIKRLSDKFKYLFKGCRLPPHAEDR